MKPTLLYDGDCGFCKHWVARWRLATGESVEYGTAKDLGYLFPQIEGRAYSEAVQLVEPNGSVYSGAEAVFRVLRYARGRSWLYWLYLTAPGFARLTEAAYRVVAQHRQLAGALTRCFWGLEFRPQTFFLGRWLFLRSLGLIFAVAFLSLYMQLDGLIGSNGILPAEGFLDAVEKRLGAERFWRIPTLAWIDSSDGFLRAMCIAGAGVSVLATVGIFAPPAFAAAWLLYLSLFTVGGDFLSFQWDILLLETAFLALFFAPWQVFPRLGKEPAPSPILLALLWWLQFRLMFSSGFVKLGDETWRDLTALAYHYYTQPLPTAAGWYAHHLPGSFHKLSVFLMFIIELVVPFFIFFPRRIRHFGAMLLIFLQVLIIITGNYGIFNWLAIALCFVLFDDAFIGSILPGRWRLRAPSLHRTVLFAKGQKAVHVAVAALILLLSVHVLGRQFAPSIDVPAPARSLLSYTYPFHLVSGYGLFANMTTTRPEIVIEGSRDLDTWRAYPFKWKAGRLDGRPRRVAPHQPRLDWQMWFAALGGLPRTRWFPNLAVRLLQGTPEVLALFESNPFPEGPPKYIRAKLFEYRFTDIATLRREGVWWRRTYLGDYMTPVSLSGR